MPITYTHQETKDRIVHLIKTRGPSLPVQIAKALNIQPLFASAFLSELYNEGRVLISHLRVGSSPLYLISGQEANLEKFTQYLNNKEREAFLHLQKNKLLSDEEQLPAIRVALRAVQDFAIPVKLKTQSQNPNEPPKLFWKYHLIPDNQIQEIINPTQTPQIPQSKPEPPKVSPQVPQVISQTTQLMSSPQQIIQSAQSQLTPSSLPLPLVSEKPKRIPKKKVPEEPSKFQSYVKEYLQTKDIEILELLTDKKKEINAKIRIDTLFGKQEYLLIAKDKKKITPADLENALKFAQVNNMPSVLMFPGDMDKKALEFQKLWKNMIKTEKLKL